MVDWNETPQSQSMHARLRELRSDFLFLKVLVIGLRFHLKFKAGYNPNQPRDNYGGWTDTGIGTRLAQADMPAPRRANLLDEESAGGHTIARHVGKKPEVLVGYVRASIEADPDPARHNIRSGSFFSLEAAEKLVSATIDRNQKIVDAVVNGILPEQRVDAYFDSITGIEAHAPTIRSQPVIRNAYGVGVYIRRDPNSSNGYRVITAYPRNLD